LELGAIYGLGGLAFFAEDAIDAESVLVAVLRALFFLEVE
jgi:hypothetical protein